MYTQVKLAQQNVAPTTTQPPVTPAPVVVGPTPVVATSPAYAPAYGIPWGWIVGGALAVGAAALLIGAVNKR